MTISIKRSPMNEQKRQIATLNRRLENLHRRLNKAKQTHEEFVQKTNEELEELRDTLAKDKQALSRVSSLRQKTMTEDIRAVSIRAIATAGEIKQKEELLKKREEEHMLLTKNIEKDISITNEILTALEGEL